METSDIQRLGTKLISSLDIKAQPLPGFAIIGAMKAGTTTLHHMLDVHPGICMSRMKETDYLIESANLSLGPDWYRGQFDNPSLLCGEASPNYTKRDLFPGVPERLAKLSPDARLIFIVRDPVARFASHYRHAWLLGHMDIMPDDLLESAPGQHMLATSRYAWQLTPWIACFGRERLLVIDFDDLVKTPQLVFDRVCDHLQVAPHPVGDVAAQNEGSSLARLPQGVQRLWRSRFLRRFDRFISRDMRAQARNLLSKGPERKAPELPSDILDRAALALSEDAAALRTLAGQPFANWRV